MDVLRLRIASLATHSASYYYALYSGSALYSSGGPKDWAYINYEVTRPYILARATMLFLASAHLNVASRLGQGHLAWRRSPPRLQVRTHAASATPFSKRESSISSSQREGGRVSSYAPPESDTSSAESVGRRRKRPWLSYPTRLACGVLAMGVAILGQASLALTFALSAGLDHHLGATLGPMEYGPTRQCLMGISSTVEGWGQNKDGTGPEVACELVHLLRPDILEVMRNVKSTKLGELAKQAWARSHAPGDAGMRLRESLKATESGGDDLEGPVRADSNLTAVELEGEASGR